MTAGLFFLRLWSGAKAAFAWVLADLRRVLALTIFLLALAFWWQTTKLAKCEEEFEAYRAAITKASEENAKAQAALIEAQRREFISAAEEADEKYETLLTQARASADSYKLANRLRQDAGSLRPATGTTEADPAFILEVASAEAVVVSERDFDTCTDLYSYARAAYEWGQSLIEREVAE